MFKNKDMKPPGDTDPGSWSPRVQNAKTPKFSCPWKERGILILWQRRRKEYMRKSTHLSSALPLSQGPPFLPLDVSHSHWNNKFYFI